MKRRLSFSGPVQVDAAAEVEEGDGLCGGGSAQACRSVVKKRWKTRRKRRENEKRAA